LVRRAKRKRLYLERWAAFVGGISLRESSAERVREWLALLKSRDGFQPVTIKGHRKLLSGFFRWCVRERLCDFNPCDAVAGPRVVNEEVAVLPVADAQKLFRVNARRPAAARMALEAFGGLRFSHAGRLEKGEVDFERKGIILAANKHKSRRRGYLEGLPECPWKWLESASDATWAMTPCQYMHEKSAAFKRAGVKNAGNVLRHSFGSYFLAWTNDAMKTAEKMQHTTPKTLYQFYKGAVSKADADQWFSIVPPVRRRRHSAADAFKKAGHQRTALIARRTAGAT
jgi:site-specific recombinase XerD